MAQWLWRYDRKSRTVTLGTFMRVPDSSTSSSGESKRGFGDCGAQSQTCHEYHTQSLFFSLLLPRQPSPPLPFKPSNHQHQHRWATQFRNIILNTVCILIPPPLSWHYVFSSFFSLPASPARDNLLLRPPICFSDKTYSLVY